MLKISRYKKYYGRHLALQTDELFIPEGIHWFKGSNGAGKSTLFKSVAGLIPFKGEVLFNRLDIRKEAVAYRRCVNYAEAEPLFPSFLSGKEIIEFAAKAKKAPAGQQERLIQQLKMESYIGSKTGSYSSGMLKKVSLAMAFLGKPGLIILDEPLITIDKEAAATILLLIREYALEGTSFLLSSHQDFEADALPIQSTYLLRNKTIFHENSSRI